MPQVTKDKQVKEDDIPDSTLTWLQFQSSFAQH